MKVLKKIVVYILSFLLVAKGFSGVRAKKWVRKVYRNFIKDRKYSIREKLWAYSHGYMPRHVKRFNINKDNVDQYLSEKDYFYIQPVNGIYRKWLANKITTRKVFKPYKAHLQKLYYQVYVRRGKIKLNRLEDCPYRKSDEKTLIRLIKKKRRVVITDPKRNRSVLIRYNGRVFYFGKKKVKNQSQLLRRIRRFNKEAIIAEYIRPGKGFKNNYHRFGNQLRIIVLNDSQQGPQIGEAFLRIDAHYTKDMDGLKESMRKYYIDNEAEQTDEETTVDSNERNESQRKRKRGYFRGIIAYVNKETGAYEKGQFILDGMLIDAEKNFRTDEVIKGELPHWAEIKDTVNSLCRYVPQLQFFAIDVLITNRTFKFVRFVNVPKYPSVQMYSPETVRFLRQKVEEKRAQSGNWKSRCKRGFKQLKLKVRRGFATAFFPKGLLPYLSVRWLKEMSVDFFTNRDVGPVKKLWAYKKGFISYRIGQYGITKENVGDFISDFEYKWLRHINNGYKSWFEDKITFKYILPEFKDCFPAYYYHIRQEEGHNTVIRMMDCPEEYERNYEDILKLARDKGVLALKPDEGSHGDGFYKLTYADDKYYLNFDEASEDDILGILRDPKNSYLITEYIESHPQFKEIYSGAVNTIRMIVFKKDGQRAQIGNTYMRFGSSQTGAVDNMGAGGMFAEVDLETGRYENAKIILKNSIKECPYHPDSGVKIEGYIPHWGEVKAKIVEIANSVPQLEYFGFDVAITEQGIKLPEINRFPDYPKIERLSPVTMQYLLKKLRIKKRKYGYDKKPCRKLVGLPKR